MKKFLLAVPLVVGVSWTGASYYTGSQSQAAYEELLAQLNELQPLTVRNESYTSGFVKSMAVTKVMKSEEPDAKVLFRLQHEINHSPIGLNEGNVRVGAAAIKTTLLKDDSLPDTVVEFMQGFVDSEPFVIDTQVSFGGSTNTGLQVRPYQYEDTEVDIAFGGIDYDMAFSGDSMVGSGIFGKIDISGDGAVLKSSPGIISYDLTYIDKLFFSGTYSIDFDSMSVSDDAQGFNASVNSVGLNSETSISGDKVSSRVDFSVGNIDSMLPLNSVSIETAVNDLSLEGIKGYMDVVTKLLSSNFINIDDPEIVKELLAAYLPVIAPGSGVEFKVAFNTDEGDARLTYGLGIIDESRPAYPAGGLSSLVTIRDLLNVLTMDVRFEADAAVIDQTPLAMFMVSPEAQQFIVADGSTYKSDITVNDFIVDINDSPMSFEMMLPGEALDMPLAAIMDK